MQLYSIIQGDLVCVSVASAKGNILQNCSVSQNIDIMSYVHVCVCVLYSFIICLGLCIHHHSQDAEEFQHH